MDLISASKEKYRKLFEFVKPYYVNKDPAHNWDHIERIIEKFDYLSDGIGTIDMNRLFFLACFHELSSKVRSDHQFREKAKTFLRSLRWTDIVIENAFASLERHIDDPVTSEEMIVHDANFLEVVGAFGIAKAFLTGGAKGQSFEEIIHFYESYIGKIKFKTPKGIGLARERVLLSEEFVKNLKSEW